MWRVPFAPNPVGANIDELNRCAAVMALAQRRDELTVRDEVSWIESVRLLEDA